MLLLTEQFTQIYFTSFFFLRPATGLLYIDHIVGNQPDLAMNDVVDW